MQYCTESYKLMAVSLQWHVTSFNRESTIYTRGLNGVGGLWAWPGGAQK